MSDTEEKTLQPTQHKLRKAREKGQVASSQDFVTAAVTTSAFIWLLFAWPSLTRTIDRLFTASLGASRGASRDAMMTIFYAFVQEIAIVLSPLLIAVTGAAIIANILAKQGIPFSLHPITPDFSRINPGNMMKKVFSKRNAAEFGISFVRLVLLFAAILAVTWYLASDILRGTLCTDACTLDSAVDLVGVLLAVVVVMLLVAGLLDLPLQSFLFHDEQKMGHNEMKRELKDTMGNAEFKSHRRNQYRGMVSTAAAGQNASVIIYGGGIAVAIRYDREEAPVPVLVARYSGPEARDALSSAKKTGLPVTEEPSLALDLHRSVQPGAAIRERHFTRVAQVLVNAGAL